MAQAALWHRRGLLGRLVGAFLASQRQMSFTSGMSWADTQQFIHYLSADDPQRRQFLTGAVDMKGYLDWLNANGYDIDLEVQ